MMKAAIRQRALELGFDDCRFTTAAAPAAAEHFQNWLAAKRHGEMAWLERNAPKRLDPQLVLPGARSVVCLVALLSLQDIVPTTLQQHINCGVVLAVLTLLGSGRWAAVGRARLAQCLFHSCDQGSTVRFDGAGKAGLRFAVTVDQELVEIPLWGFSGGFFQSGVKAVLCRAGHH